MLMLSHVFTMALCDIFLTLHSQNYAKYPSLANEG